MCLQCRRPRFDPWVGKILWQREWQSTPVFLSGEFHGQRSLVGYNKWGHEESDPTEWLNTFTPHLVVEQKLTTLESQLYSNLKKSVSSVASENPPSPVWALGIVHLALPGIFCLTSWGFAYHTGGFVFSNELKGSLCRFPNVLLCAANSSHLIFPQIPVSACSVHQDCSALPRYLSTYNAIWQVLPRVIQDSPYFSCFQGSQSCTACYPSSKISCFCIWFSFLVLYGGRKYSILILQVYEFYAQDFPNVKMKSTLG